MFVVRRALGRSTDGGAPIGKRPRPRQPAHVAEDEIAYRIGVPGAPEPTVPTPVRRRDGAATGAQDPTGRADRDPTGRRRLGPRPVAPAAVRRSGADSPASSRD